jgi:hypothetical protein
MIDAADDFPGLKVSIELDVFAYEEVLKEEPECIELLKEYIAADRVAIAGGTYSQPFGQNYGWEPNIRQLVYGRNGIREITGYDVQAFLVEEQWFHPQLPQLLKLAGFIYASLQNPDRSNLWGKLWSTGSALTISRSLQSPPRPDGILCAPVYRSHGFSRQAGSL